MTFRLRVMKAEGVGPPTRASREQESRVYGRCKLVEGAQQVAAPRNLIDLKPV